MAPESAAVTPPEAGMGEFSRLIGIFFEPKRAFTDIARRPTWIVPMILVIVAAVGVVSIISQRVGWERVVRQRIETSAQNQQMSAEQREQAVATGAKFASVGSYAGVILGIPIVDVIMAAVLLGIAGGIMSGGMSFKQVFAVVCYSGLPGIISAILVVVVLFLKNPDEVNVQNPLAFNLGAFLDPNSTSKFTYSLATSMDLFVFWTILLIATGLKAAAGKKLSFAGALVAVGAPWAIYVFCKAALSGAFG